MSDTLLDVLEITFTQEAHEDPCENPDDSCSRVAIWDFVSTCGCVWALCQECREEADRIFSEMPKFWYYECARCSAPYPTYRYVPHRRNR